MLPEALRHIDCWIFDLDNSLYPASADLFALIDRRMTLYIQQRLGCDAEQAFRVQKGYFRDHGTTLAGLMREHGVDPYEFLGFVHDIELARIAADPRLVAALDRLPGRKLVFTNGDESYARRVLERLGLGNAFHGLHDIHAMNYVPKPDPAAYAALCDGYEVDPARALFVEDMARNLKPAKALGMTTVWIDNGSEQAEAEADPAFIDYRITDIGDWLTEITGESA
ncbi:MAG: pyrimidine 5'-nucleotidase [Alphaproteobacteria bacterium]|nr:pyrimidine 5'-nucleotidase [Alphaproteobacteria bacterium]